LARPLRRLTSEDIEDREARVAVDAAAQVERRADVAREERVAALAGRLSCALDLLDGVHREAARALEPALVSRPRVELQERVAVAGRAVAKAGALRERTRLPRQLAARFEQRREVVVATREVCQRRDDPRRAVA